MMNFTNVMQGYVIVTLRNLNIWSTYNDWLALFDKNISYDFGDFDLVSVK